jgi:hypothetical protein
MKHYEESIVLIEEAKEQTLLIERVEPEEDVKVEMNVKEAEDEDMNDFHILETA